VEFLTDLPPACCPHGFRDGFVVAEGGGGGERDAAGSRELTKAGFWDLV